MDIKQQQKWSGNQDLPFQDCKYVIRYVAQNNQIIVLKPLGATRIVQTRGIDPLIQNNADVMLSCGSKPNAIIRQIIKRYPDGACNKQKGKTHSQ